jgi:cation diffusion facilitator CzcD-associated flavoprotein CzcO
MVPETALQSRLPLAADSARMPTNGSSKQEGWQMSVAHHVNEPPLDVVVVGAGFAGLAMLHSARTSGMSARLLEKGDGVGGTWFWNRYPGARCDIESFDYAYSFSPEILAEWRWSERYARQPEILRYLNFVADKLDLGRDISFGSTVTAITFDEGTMYWTVELSTGEEITARHCVLGIGNLSKIVTPEYAGLDRYGGKWYHTGMWPAEGVGLDRKRVAVIGTGSSGIQTVTAIAAEVDHLYVLQRTPNYSMPAQNRPITETESRAVLASWAERRRTCEWSDAGTPLPPANLRAVDVSDVNRDFEYEAGWQRGGIGALSGAFNDMFTSEKSNQYAQDFARAKIRETVRNPEVADLLCPVHHIGTKRTCVDTGYFEVFNRDNVELVDIRVSPIVEIVESGINLRDRTIAVDVIIFAIGFDAITGAFDQIEIRGRKGQRLRDKWRDGPRTLLGVQTAGFPNLFFITGPGSPSVLSNMVVSIEQHVDWIADCLRHLRANHLTCIEPTNEAEDDWMSHVDDLARGTLYPQANSWYSGTNVLGKPRVFNIYTAGCHSYRSECENVVAAGYYGFVMSDNIASVDKENRP